MDKREPVFWSLVRKTDGCWEWLGNFDRYGYPLFSAAHIGIIRAHRYSYHIHNGAIPEKLFVCHHCDNPGCTNPDHLFLGTAADNFDDMVSKGRWDGKPERVFSEGEINNILMLREAGNSTHKIAAKLKADHSKISKILRDKRIALKPDAAFKAREDSERIANLRSKGASLTAIAKEYEVDKGTIKAILEEIGAYSPQKPGPRKPHNARTAELRENLAEIRLRKAQGESITKIAQSLGADRHTLTRLLKSSRPSEGGTGTDRAT